MPEDNTPKIVKPIRITAPSAEQLSQTFDVQQLPQLENSEGGRIAEGSTYSPEEVDKAVKKAGWDEKGTKVVEPKKEEVKNEEVIDDKVDDTSKQLEDKGEKKEVEEEEDPFKGLEDEESLPEFLKPPVKVDGRKKVEEPEGDVNYSEFSEAEVKHMKNMSKQSRRAFADLIKQNKDLSSSKQLSFLQHPQGYMLSEEYQKLQTDVGMAQAQYNHWKQQIINCKAGKPVKGLEVNDKGEVVVSSKEHQPTDEIEEECRQSMMQCQQVDRELRGKLHVYPKQYADMVGRDLGVIRNEIKNKCPWVANPKYLDYTTDIHYPNGVVKQESIRTVRDNFINLFPPYMRNHIALEVAANLMVANVLNEAKVRHLSGKAKAATTKVQEVSLAEPSVAKGKPQPKPKVNGVSSFDTAGAGIEFGR